ncbi:MAG TPA: hypothetical protein VI548_11645 [Chitinophagaceae bacterium]|nr:hypothetical protein [Chitinophagaceae bacterium]
MKYEIVLLNEKEKFYKIINWILLALNFIAIFFLTLSIHFTKTGPLILSALALFSVFSIHYFKRGKKNIIHSTPFFIFSLAWFATDFWWAGVLNLFFMVLSILSLRKLVVTVTEVNITYPFIFFNKINWIDLNLIILKDGILTIDFKNNKLIQQLIDDTKCAVDEKEFNDFCKSRLKIDH